MTYQTNPNGIHLDHIAAWRLVLPYAGPQGLKPDVAIDPNGTHPTHAGLLEVMPKRLARLFHRNHWQRLDRGMNPWHVHYVAGHYGERVEMLLLHLVASTGRRYTILAYPLE